MRSFLIFTLMIATFLQTGCSSRAKEEKPIVAIQVEVPLTTQSDEARAIFLQARVQFDNLRFSEARELFSAAIEKDPEFATAHLYRAFTATSAMDFQHHLQQAVALAPNVSEGERLFIEAQQANAQNDPVKQVELLEQLVEKFPNDTQAHMGLGIAYFNRDEDKMAIAEFQKAVEIDSDFAPTYNMLGYAYREIGDYEQSEEAFQNYIRLIPDEANPHDSMADLYTKMGRHQDAISHYQKALELNTKFAFSQRKIGDNLVFMGQYDEGRSAYRKAAEIETSPSGKIIDVLRVGTSYLYEGKYEEALAESDKGLQMAVEAGLPNLEAGIHSAKCLIYIEMGNPDKAEQSNVECMRVVAESDLSLATKENFAKTTLFNEARIAAKRQDFEAAMAKADEFKAKIDAGLDPKEIEDYHDFLGYIYSEKGEYAMAIEHLSQADQEEPYTLYLLAVAESEAGDKARGAELFEKVAHWNQSSLNYAFVRSEAMAAVSE